MKKIMFALMFLTGIARADSLFSIPGLASAAADAAKSSKAIGLVDLNGHVSGGAFVPLRTLHDGSGINYMEVGIGGAIKQEEHFKPLGIVNFDLSAIFRKVENYSSWYGNHVAKKTLLDFWAGPYIATPLPGYLWTWKSAVGGSVSMGF